MKKKFKKKKQRLGMTIFIKNNNNRQYIYLSSTIRKLIDRYPYVEIWYDPNIQKIHLKLLEKPTKNSYAIPHREKGGVMLNLRKVLKVLQVKEGYYPARYNQGVIEFTYERDENA